MGEITLKGLTAFLTWLGKMFPSTVLAAVITGVILLGVPTFFEFFGDRFLTGVPARIAIMVLWTLIAVIALAQAAERDRAMRDLAEARKTQLAQLRKTATTDILDALLRQGTKEIPPSYEFTVYTFDEGSGELVPFWPPLQPPEEPDPRIFRPGNGATGSAWKDQETLVVRGTEVANDVYGLTKRQQDFFSEYRSVAATPIWEEGRTPIGVLTAIGKDDDAYFSSGGGRDSLKALADTVGVVLVNVAQTGDDS